MEYNVRKLDGLRIGYALTGSFCTFAESLAIAEHLAECGATLIPIMSENASSMDTRFGKAKEHIERLEKAAGRSVIRTIVEAEQIGPKKMCDIMVVAPCTGNTMAKLANSITDTSVTMAVKSHIRNARPALLCLATNDALAGSAQNIGKLLNMKPFYFVPFGQDDHELKPTSVIADFDLLPAAIVAAMDGKQVQPIMMK